MPFKKIKETLGYLKAGIRIEQQRTARLQRIKNTPENFRSKADQEYADKMNKTKRRVMGSFKKGGKVKKTGLYKLHKGEKVIPAKKKKKK